MAWISRLTLAMGEVIQFPKICEICKHKPVLKDMHMPDATICEDCFEKLCEESAANMGLYPVKD